MRSTCAHRVSASYGPNEYEGTEIGLAICRKTGESHGGKLTDSYFVDSGNEVKMTKHDIIHMIHSDVMSDAFSPINSRPANLELIS